MPYIGKTPTVGNFQVCDAISVVNGQAAYTLQVGGVNVAPESANHMLVSLNGILPKPGSSFTISGSTMTFASNLATGDVIDFVQILGNVLDLGTPSDDTVTAAKLNNDIISGQTALTSTPDDTDEFLVSDAGTIKRIDYSLIKGSTSTPAFHVGQATGQSISNDTFTKITLDHTELLDTDNAFSSSRFTPQTAGTYLIYGMVRLHGADDFDNMNVAIYKNSDRVLDMQGSYFHYETKNVFGMVTLNGSSDYVELFCRQVSGSSKNTRPGDISGAQTFFGGFKIT